METTPLGMDPGCKEPREIRKKIDSLHFNIIRTFSLDEWNEGEAHLGLPASEHRAPEGRDGDSPLCNYLIYSYRPQGINLAERYLRSRKRMDAFTRTVLERMSQTTYSVFLVEPFTGDGEPASDRIPIRDLASGESWLLVDQMIQTITRSTPYRLLGAHLLPCDSFLMQTGHVQILGTGLDSEPSATDPFMELQARRIPRTDGAARSALAREILAALLDASDT
jgi:hypothetical protein